MGDMKMHPKITRRDVMKGGLASLGLATLGVPFGVMPALAQDETVVPFLDFPANFNANPRAGSRFLDTRTINNFITPADQFYTFQHFGQPQIDKATFKLKMTGMFTTPREFTLQEIQSLKPLEQIVAYECGGNGPRNNAQGMVSNGRWKGTSLASFLKRCGIVPKRRKSFFTAPIFRRKM
jgi:DMSO/TMAO reductase YedYZ molybdopterin-dependent catalytic subunit